VEVLKYAASVDAHSQHPLATAIVAASPETFPVKGFKSIPGKGAGGEVNGKNVKVGGPGLLRQEGLAVPEADRVKQLQAEGKTVVFVIVNGFAQGAVALADIIRPESKQAMQALKQMGVRCIMLTGDNQPTAKWVSEQIGLDEYIAEVLPQEKAAKVKEVQSRGLTVAMTGDGVNDAPALAQADVGIAIGAGTDVAVETADIVLVRSNPLDVVAILGLSRSTYRKMIQNLLWATGYNAFAIPLAAGALVAYGVLLTPAMGAVLMSVSTVIVAINASTPWRLTIDLHSEVGIVNAIRCELTGFEKYYIITTTCPAAPSNPSSSQHPDSFQPRVHRPSAAAGRVRYSVDTPSRCPHRRCRPSCQRRHKPLFHRNHGVGP